MSSLLRKAAVALAMLVVLPALAAGIPTAAVTAPAAATPAATAPADAVPVAEGVGCTSTRACTPAHGGAYFSTTRNSCTAGLPARSRSGQWYVVTAGHCVANARGATWKQGRLVLGKGTRWEYGRLGTEGAKGAGDIGIIKITANGSIWKARSRVLVLGARGARTERITGAKNARSGERVCVTAGRSGTTRCGTVIAADTSFGYASPGLPSRTVRNLALVKGICVQPGDSGSPVFAGHAAVGIVTARSSSGCYLWYSKLPAKLTQYGLTVAA